MGDGLALEAQMEEGGLAHAVEDQVADQRADKNCAEAHQQFGLAKQHHVTDAAHHAQAGTLGQSAHDQTGDQADGNSGMLGAGAAARFGE